jgi:hypothetical protein
VEHLDSLANITFIVSTWNKTYEIVMKENDHISQASTYRSSLLKFKTVELVPPRTPSRSAVALNAAYNVFYLSLC